MSDKRNDFGPVRTRPAAKRPYAARPERVHPARPKTEQSGTTDEKRAVPDRKSGGEKTDYRKFEHKSGGVMRARPGKGVTTRKNMPDRKERGRDAVRPGATDGMPARRIALDVIRKVTEEGAWASLALDQKLHGCTLSGADRRFAARLAYDTLDNLMRLDHALRQVMAKPDTDIRLVNILRLGACQLLLDYRVPENAATDTSVRLCKELGLDGLSGVCNGILRNLIRRRDELSWPDPAAEPLKALSLQASVPEWLTKRLLDDWGEADGAALVRWRARGEGITLRPNLLRLDDAGFEELLKKKVWEREPGRVPHSVKVRGMIDITADADWQQGMYSIQSEGSQTACLAVDPKPGWRVLDCCAAPGGKSCYLDEMMRDAGRVQAWEIREHRTELIAAQARRLRLENVRPMTRDASVRREDLDMTFDAVLLDAPCSGTGDMAEKPDIKLRLTEEKVAEMTRIQAELLDNVCLAVKPGGVLVYATCSLLRDENDRQIAAFLERHPDFHLEPLPETVPAALRAHEAVGLQLMPHRDGIGGFYVCRMRRDRL